MGCDSTNSSANPAANFPNAATMESLATNYSVVWEEICMIQQALLTASTAGRQMCTTVGGATPMTFTSGVAGVDVVSGGSGYWVDTPSVVFIPPVGVTPTDIATGTVVTNGGNILSITITNGGLGYQPVSATMGVSSIAGTGAVLHPLVDASGSIVNIDIANGGSGYTVDDTVTATRAVVPNIAYVNAVFKIISVGITGEIIDIAILTPGSGYQPSTTTVSIVSSLNTALPYPLGTGAMFSVYTDLAGTITQVITTNSGAGYSSFPPYLVLSNSGSGAQTAITLRGESSIASVAVISPGSNYVLPITGTILNPPTASLPNPPSVPAQVTVNIAVNTYGTTPNLYWQVWAGTTTNKPIQLQMNQVLSYFTGLGYTIQIQSNPQTGSTIQWKICW